MNKKIEEKSLNPHEKALERAFERMDKKDLVLTCLEYYEELQDIRNQIKRISRELQIL